ncbi:MULTISPECIES: type II toxin-antitoxin system RelE/ParE family toxin [Pseudomonas]|uniref:Type II toxin-antitoxin system RelE/ParE family toxin n=1 Tax=Pseudomonas donghuensis TaxID=1163398 RepID=A0AAP0SNK3_9PSED|nr:MULTISPECIES: type II toxin-antitoxin system RelE/ParE family toxin [Pseudomonas]MDF9891806.1 putative addiction module killer protein [Pseudomonas vranovensis]KDO02095.2 type II toxin-antitoxin system RelE/ParE family toxin [Pseudomonas donghuensis]MBF4209128.1 type II toxin-antitoxin system RelE/ParE family toxin [Pseudomonas donghuensis]MBS7599475.1 type II toxin-antitoxin system RelE/ParE family toxin [Pseudomonas sp. RC2C2]MCP6693390.1 type II toxin-antitoxin system RelE/ParE family to
MKYSVLQTPRFTSWLISVRDMRARVAIARRIERVTAGNLGDVKSVGGQVCEMRIDVGAGYRVYFTARDGVVIVLLAGGDKSSQSVDIQLARKLAKEI